MSSARHLAFLYLAAVVLSAGWAFYIDASLLHSPQEHELPDLLSFLLALPSSWSISLLYDTWPTFFSKPFTQTVWITLCGLAQAALLLAVTRPRPRRPNQSFKRTREKPRAA